MARGRVGDVRVTLVSQNVQFGAQGSRWKGLSAQIRELEPDLVLLQEVDWLADPDAAREAGRALGMELVVAPSRNLPVAIGWNPSRFAVAGMETKYWQDLHHGYAAARLDVLGLGEPLPAPLVVISTHLTPYSAQTASQEAQLLIARAYRYQALGIIGGDINHPPVGDPEPAWEQIQPYNRAARCVRRSEPDDPWRADTIVGQVFFDGDMTDVAGHLADTRGEPALRRATGKAGGIRVDQVHVTPALRPAIEEYEVVETDYSDHRGLRVVFDFARVDRARLREYS